MKDVSGYRIEILEPGGISAFGEKIYNRFGEERIGNMVLIKMAGCPSILCMDLTRSAEGQSS